MQSFLIYCVGFCTLLGTTGQVSAGLIYSAGYSGDWLVTIDSSTGVTSPIDSFGKSNSHGMAFHPHGTLYLTSNRENHQTELYTVNYAIDDPDRGKASFVALLDPGPDLSKPDEGELFFSAIDFHNEDRVLYGMNGAGQLYTFDHLNGAGTHLKNTGVKGIGDISFDSSGYLYGASSTTLYKFDPASGDEIASWTIDWEADGDLRGLMFDENDDLYATTYVFGAKGHSLFKLIMTGTGDGDDLALVEGIGAGQFRYGPSGGDFAPSGIAPVPEPGSLALLGVGAATMALTGAWRRRRRGGDVA